MEHLKENANIGNTPQPRSMTLNDLNSVAKLHRQCFQGTISIFTPLSDNLLKRYYAQAVEEPESFATVLEEPGTKNIVGLAIATIKKGFPRRFIRRHFLQFFLEIFFKLFISKILRESLKKRLKYITRLLIGRGDTELADIGPLPMEGKEAFFMLSGVDVKWRGGGNPERLIKYAVNQMYEKGVTRIRGSISPDNLASLILFKRLGWNTKKISANEICAWIDKTN